MYTNQDVLDAYFADTCANDARVDETSPAQAATAYLTIYTNNRVDHAATATARADALARLARGMEILASARLVVTKNRQTTDAITLASNIAPTVLISAGHIGTADAYRQVTLRSKALITTITLADAASLWQVDAATLRADTRIRRLTAISECD